MSDEKKNPGHRFEPGHVRYGGRRKNTVAQARALADELGICPMRFLLLCIDGTVTKTVIENGKRKKVAVDIPLDMRIDCAKHVSRFLFPTLSAAAVQAEVAVDMDAQVALPIDAILARPALADALGDLALLVSQQSIDDTKLLPGPELDRVIGD